jgi:hypothetical protein
MREPIHNDVQPPVVPERAKVQTALRNANRWRATALVAVVLLVPLVLLLLADRGSPPAQAASVAAAFKATEQAASQTGSQFQSEQAKAEIALLREALQAAHVVVGHHRHHSEVMWDLIAGRITPREAWWRGGDATCAGWVAAGEFEVAEGKLKGRDVKPPPIPAEGLKFCKQARERK